MKTFIDLGYTRISKMISRHTPPACRFDPSCSHYGLQAYKQHGFGKGSVLTLWRVLRCNPFFSRRIRSRSKDERTKSMRRLENNQDSGRLQMAMLLSIVVLLYICLF